MGMAINEIETENQDQRGGGVSAPAVPSPARRRFGTPLVFTADGTGRWVWVDPTSDAGDRWEIERRRAEPDAPSGWYVHGPNIFGRRAGQYVENAADLVVELSGGAPDDPDDPDGEAA
jgi:hypothetical protein